MTPVKQYTKLTIWPSKVSVISIVCSVFFAGCAWHYDTPSLPRPDATCKYSGGGGNSGSFCRAYLTEIEEAAYRGDANTVRSRISDVTTPIERASLIEWAAFGAYPEVLRVLVNAGLKGVRIAPPDRLDSSRAAFEQGIAASFMDDPYRELCDYGPGRRRHWQTFRLSVSKSEAKEVVTLFGTLSMITPAEEGYLAKMVAAISSCASGGNLNIALAIAESVDFTAGNPRLLDWPLAIAHKRENSELAELLLRKGARYDDAMFIRQVCDANHSYIKAALQAGLVPPIDRAVVLRSCPREQGIYRVFIAQPIPETIDWLRSVGFDLSARSPWGATPVSILASQMVDACLVANFETSRPDEKARGLRLVDALSPGFRRLLFHKASEDGPFYWGGKQWVDLRGYLSSKCTDRVVESLLGSTK